MRRVTEQTTSRELMARAQAGEVDAFAEIYSTYRPLILAFLASRVGPRQVVEDLAQDVFVRALRSIGRWQWQGKDVGAWLITIARNLVADYRKATEQRLRADVQNFEGLASSMPDSTPQGDTEAAVIDVLRNAAVVTALRQLNEYQRTCLVNRYILDLSVADTARVLGCSQEAVRTLTARAVQALRELLEVRDPDLIRPRAVRVWAQANGVKCGPRGRIRPSVIDAYKAATTGGAR